MTVERLKRPNHWVTAQRHLRAQAWTAAIRLQRAKKEQQAFQSWRFYSLARAQKAYPSAG